MGIDPLPVAVAVFVASLVIMLLLGRHIRHGDYPREPVEHHGEEWYAVPARLRLSLHVSVGAAFGAFVAAFLTVIDKAIVVKIHRLSGWTTILLPLFLFVFESKTSARTSHGRKPLTIAVSLLLGAAIAVALVDTIGRDDQ